ncbi:MAG: ion channel [Cytophagales bacterium]|nr:ion channel [Cytophagales bacterium]
MKTTSYRRIIFQSLLGLGLLLGLVFLLLQFERGAKESSITNFENALWYTFSTLTTVGYGDLYPATLYGRVVGYVLLFLSLGAYGLLISKIGSIMHAIRKHRKMGHGGTSFKGHSVVLGWDDITRDVTNQLIGVLKKVAVVTDDPRLLEHIQDTYKDNSFLFSMCLSDMGNLDGLERVNISEAKVVFINLGKDLDNLVHLLNLKKLYSQQEYVVILDNSELKSTFMSAGATYTVSKNEIAAKMLASYIFEPDVASYSEDILSYAEDGEDYDIKEYKVLEKNPYVNREYGFAFTDFKKKFNAVLIGLGREGSGGERILIKNPRGNVKVSAGDFMILILNGQSSSLVEKVFGIQEGV